MLSATERAELCFGLWPGGPLDQGGYFVINGAGAQKTGLCECGTATSHEYPGSEKVLIALERMANNFAVASAMFF